MRLTLWQERNPISKTAIISTVVATLLVTSAGGALAQSVAEDQYFKGSNQQAPVAPGDSADPGFANPDSAQANPSQAPVGPNDPAYPGLDSQPPETFSQALTQILADLDAISLQLAALSTSPSTTAAPPTTSPPGATTPATVMTGGSGTIPVPVTSAPTAVLPGTTPGQAPTAIVNPFTTITSATSVANGLPYSSGLGDFVIGGNYEPAFTVVDECIPSPAVACIGGGDPAPSSFVPEFVTNPNSSTDLALSAMWTQHNSNLIDTWLLDDPDDIDGDLRIVTDYDPDDPFE